MSPRMRSFLMLLLDFFYKALTYCLYSDSTVSALVVMEIDMLFIVYIN